MVGAAAAVAQARAVVVQNLVPLPRREVVAAVVPFARGEVRGLPDLHVADRATAWQPFGARWPDGSLRQALCLFAAEAPALGELQLALEAGPGPELPGGAVPIPAFDLAIACKRSGAEQHAHPVAIEVLEQNALRTVELRRCRIGDSGLVAEVILTACRDQAHVWADLAVFFSDPRTQAMQLAVDEVAVETQGMALVCRSANRFGIDQTTTATGSRVVLLRTATLGDGQGIRRCGVLVPPLSGDTAVDTSSRAAGVAPLLAATPWTASAAFGAFGFVPEPPPWLAGQGLRAHLAARHQRFARDEAGRGGPFDLAPLLGARNASQTGDQYDFGVVKLSLVARSGLPSPLLEAEASVLQEACRPVHFFEATGAPVEPARHPEWIVWSGRTHWHDGQSPDRLGKPVPAPEFDAHGWTGKDRQHWSSNFLGAYALLTGAHWARRELQNEVRLYLSGQTLDPAKTTSNAGAPRGAGRTELAASWMWLATGDEALRARMNERLDRVYAAQWAGRAGKDGTVRPFEVADPDARMLQGRCRYWTPWQEAIAAVGFGAAYEVTGNAHARELAEQLAMNCVRYGWKVTERECIVATALRWQDGGR
ncbi:MAG: hypothetical protein U1E73_09195 [Planctomycetota bacterium]